MVSKAQIAKLAKKQRDTAKRGLTAQYDNTRSCWSFYNADQMTYADRIQFADTFGRKRRAMVNFNKVQQNVDAVVGFAAQNRREANYNARLNDPNQELYSRNMNAIYDYTRENTHADQLETEQDLDMMVNGYGATDTDVSYIVGNATMMPNGEIIKEKLDPECIYWDPSAKGKNLMDARYIGYWKEYDLKDALDLFEGSTDQDFEPVSETEQDTGYTFNPYGGIYDKIKMEDTVEWANQDEEKVRVCNHQWFQYETFYKARNPIYDAATVQDAMFYKARLDKIKAEIKQQGDTFTEDMFEFNPSAETLVFDEATKRKLKEDFGTLINPVSFKRKAFYTAVVSGTHVFTWFKSVSQQGFSIQVKTGTYNRTEKRFEGMVNAMMEPQKYYNKALTELLFTIASNSKGGVMVEEDAVEDIADFEKKWAKTDAVIKVRAGALAQGKIQEKTRAAVPTNLESIIQLSDANISANGVDPAFLGDIQREDQSGILYKRRIRQVISKFARYFDSITLYQKMDARVCADLLRVWVENNEGEWIRITGPDGADQFLQLTSDMLAPEYDVSIEEAPQSPEDQQEQVIILSGMADKFLGIGDIQTGKVILAESIRDMRLDSDTKARLLEALKPQQIDPAKYAAMEQQLQQLQSLIQSGQVEKTQSETFKNMAQGQKTLADADLTGVKIPNTQADTVKKLEEAQRTNIEAEKAAQAPVTDVNVTL